MKWSNQAAHLAAEIISASSRMRPADRVLREYLRNLPHGLREIRGEIARSVFAWFRWREWIDGNLEPNVHTVRRAVELQQSFTLNPDKFPIGELKSKAVPSWVSRQLDVSADWIRSVQREPTLWLRFPRDATESGSVSEESGRPLPLVRGDLPHAWFYQGSVDLFRTEAFQNGLMEIQDIASQAVSMICDPKPGETWWDACAGEGGKTMHLSDLMENKGLVWATDPAEWRLKRLRVRAARARRFNIRLAHWRDTRQLPTKTKFDGVLVDAPCSGIGTWQRNPHARWTSRESDIDEMAQIQLQLLLLASKALKPGGRLVYSVCTMSETETELLVHSFQEKAEGLKPLPTSNPFDPGKAARACWKFWPQESGGNGMFVAGWLKEK